MKLDITGIGSELQGVGRAPDGRVVFVPGALPGETVRVTPTDESARFLTARLEEVIAPSPDRVEPICPHYARCGGCRSQHMTHACALRLKRQVIAQQLSRIGGVADAPVREPIAADRVTRYRNKAEFSVVASDAGEPVIGMFGEGGDAPLPVTECLLQHEGVGEALDAVRGWMRRERIAASDVRAARPGLRFIVTRVNQRGEMMVTLSGVGGFAVRPEALWADLASIKKARVVSLGACALAPRPTHALDGRVRALFGPAALEETLCGLRFDMSAQTFFQVNHDQTEKLYQCALQAAGLTGRESVIDAYCGCGTISLMLARHARRVTGVELNERAVADARVNARRNDLAEKAEFIAADAGRMVSQMMREGRAPDVLVVDPPRKGVDARLIDAIIASRIGRVVYVSCNPGTLARDAGRLIRGGYRLHYVQPVDMFPMTEHVETVCCLDHQ